MVSLEADVEGRRALERKGYGEVFGVKSVLISIRPEWCKMIAEGKKTIEVRKTRPKLECPFQCYIYCTSGKTVRTPQKPYCKNIDGSIVYKRKIMNVKVVGEFTCDRIDTYPFVQRKHPELNGARDCADGWYGIYEEELRDTCLSEIELKLYGSHADLYGWHISGLKIYDEPRELSEFGRIRDCEKCDEPRASACNQCIFDREIKHPPQSWCYVEGGV
jgi:predicted transcriptional regulator